MKLNRNSWHARLAFHYGNGGMFNKPMTICRYGWAMMTGVPFVLLSIALWTIACYSVFTTITTLMFGVAITQAEPIMVVLGGLCIGLGMLVSGDWSIQQFRRAHCAIMARRLNMTKDEYAQYRAEKQIEKDMAAYRDRLAKSNSAPKKSLTERFFSDTVLGVWLKSRRDKFCIMIEWE